jgi:RNA polymerase sigma-70 factor, ECF subfamily
MKRNVLSPFDQSESNHVDRKREQSLIDEAKQGSGDAFSQLYFAYVGKIYHYLYARVSSERIAEDLTGDVFVRVLEGLPTYEDRATTILAWIYRIAHARVVDYYRTTGRSDKHEDINELEISVEDDVDDQLMGRYQAEAIQAALLTLTSEQQQVIMLRFVEGYSLETTAGLLGKTESAVKSLQHRAVQRLSRALEGQNITGDA